MFGTDEELSQVANSPCCSGFPFLEASLSEVPPDTLNLGQASVGLADRTPARKAPEVDGVGPPALLVPPLKARYC